MNTPLISFDELPVQPTGRAAPEWWGILWLVVIEATVFTALIASYFHLRVANPLWPLPPAEAPALPLATANTLLLVATALPVYLGVRDLRRGSERTARIAMPAGIAMLIVFAGLKTYEYAHEPWGVTTNAYGSVVLLMTGLHLTHVAAVLLKSAVIWSYLRSGRVDARRPAPLEANALYWYFVILVWLPLYATIYLSPRLL